MKLEKIRKIFVNTKNSRLKAFCRRTYKFMIQKFGELLNKIVIIDFVDTNTIKKIKKQIWGIEVYTDTVTLLFDNCIQIYLCLEVIKQNSKIHKNNFYDELGLVLIHSFLHGLGKEEDEVRDIQYSVYKQYKDFVCRKNLEEIR